jgi:shikimate kinase
MTGAGSMPSADAPRGGAPPNSKIASDPAPTTTGSPPPRAVPLTPPDARRSTPDARSLVLVGLPGVGKSTVGAAVAERLGWPFLDFDVEIERREGCSVAELFARRGERYFRDRERELTVELAGRVGVVLAPGGGWMAQPGLVALLRPPATIIYLAASPAEVARRLGAARAARPLLGGDDPVARLERLLAEREPAYRRADAVIDTELFDEQEVIHTIAALASPSEAG